MSYGLDMNNLPSFIYSSFYRYSDNEKHITRYYPDDVLLIMLEGTCYFKEDGHPVKISKGQYYIQKRNLFQEGTLPCSNAYYYFITFAGYYNENQKTLPILGTSHMTEACTSFEQLDFLQKTNASQIELNAEFYRILIKLKKELSISHNQKITTQIIELITADLRKNYSLDELAAIFGYSKNYLIQIFKKEIGQTPFSYIQNIRLQNARQLLENSDMPVQLISDQCGFGSYVNFYKAFIKQYQASPDAYRKSSRELQY